MKRDGDERRLALLVLCGLTVGIKFPSVAALPATRMGEEGATWRECSSLGATMVAQLSCVVLAVVVGNDGLSNSESPNALPAPHWVSTSHCDCHQCASAWIESDCDQSPRCGQRDACSCRVQCPLGWRLAHLAKPPKCGMHRTQSPCWIHSACCLRKGPPCVEGLASGYNCQCGGSYNHPVPPLSTHHWLGMYKAPSMANWNNPWARHSLRRAREVIGDTATPLIEPQLEPIPPTPIDSGASAGSTMSRVMQRIYR